MLGDIWISSKLTAERLGITEIKLSNLRENEYSSLEFIGKAPLSGRKNPGNPKHFIM